MNTLDTKDIDFGTVSVSAPGRVPDDLYFGTTNSEPNAIASDILRGNVPLERLVISAHLLISEKQFGNSPKARASMIRSEKLLLRVDRVQPGENCLL